MQLQKLLELGLAETNLSERIELRRERKVGNKLGEAELVVVGVRCVVREGGVAGGVERQTKLDERGINPLTELLLVVWAELLWHLQCTGFKSIVAWF